MVIKLDKLGHKWAVAWGRTSLAVRRSTSHNQVQLQFFYFSLKKPTSMSGANIKYISYRSFAFCQNSTNGKMSKWNFGCISLTWSVGGGQGRGLREGGVGGRGTIALSCRFH